MTKINYVEKEEQSKKYSDWRSGDWFIMPNGNIRMILYNPDPDNYSIIIMNGIRYGEIENRDCNIRYLMEFTYGNANLISSIDMGFKY
jgi:hypothetical protein